MNITDVLWGGDERSKIRMKYYVRTSVVYILYNGPLVKTTF